MGTPEQPAAQGQEHFKGRIVEQGGKKVVQIEAKSVEINHPDGRRDVIVRVPSLSLIANAVSHKR